MNKKLLTYGLIGGALFLGLRALSGNGGSAPAATAISEGSTSGGGDFSSLPSAFEDLSRTLDLGPNPGPSIQMDAQQFDAGYLESVSVGSPPQPPRVLENSPTLYPRVSFPDARSAMRADFSVATLTQSTRAPYMADEYYANLERLLNENT